MQVTPAIEEYAQKKIAHAIQPYQSVVNDVDVKLSVRGGDASRGERYTHMTDSVLGVPVPAWSALPIQGRMIAQAVQQSMKCALVY
jgi:ribosome-associated translation inhibitor RaiA